MNKDWLLGCNAAGESCRKTLLHIQQRNCRSSFSNNFWCSLFEHCMKLVHKQSLRSPPHIQTWIDQCTLISIDGCIAHTDILVIDQSVGFARWENDWKNWIFEHFGAGRITFVLHEEELIQLIGCSSTCNLSFSHSHCSIMQYIDLVWLNTKKKCLKIQEYSP